MENTAEDADSSDTERPMIELEVVLLVQFGEGGLFWAIAHAQGKVCAQKDKQQQRSDFPRDHNIRTPTPSSINVSSGRQSITDGLQEQR